MPKNVPKRQDFTDIPVRSWMDRWLPESWVPYAKTMRLDRPIGVLLLAFPGWWAIAMAGKPDQIPYLFLLFGLGAVLMRGAGCAYNDWVDKDLDAKVMRTKTRPLASGQLSNNDVLKLIAGLLLFSFFILMLLPIQAIGLGFMVLIPVALYPWMKRFTYWPQLFLGIAFNWGALMGWAAATDGLSPSAWLLYFAGIFWTLIYDTIYAHQDKEDDLLIGIRSTAIKFGENTRSILLAFTGAVMVLLFLAGYKAEMELLYYLATLAIAGGVGYQLLHLDFNQPIDCLKAFKQQAYVGWGLLIAIALGRVF